MLAGVPRQSDGYQRGVLGEPEPTRNRKSSNIGHECLIEDEPLLRERCLCHRANQTQCVPLASMVRMSDHARIHRAVRVRAELTEGDDLILFERRPDIRRCGIDAAVIPVLRGARRLEKPHGFRLRLWQPPHAVRSHRAEAIRWQPTLKRRPDDLAGGMADHPDCQIGRQEFLRDGVAEVPLKLDDQLGRGRNHCRAAANEEPDPAVAVKRRVRRDDNAWTPKRRFGYAEEP